MARSTAAGDFENRKMRRHLAIMFLMVSVFLAFLLATRRVNVCRSTIPPIQVLASDGAIDAPEMLAKYEILDDRYFAGRLPKNTEIKWSPELAYLDDMGLTIHETSGFTIYLDIQMRDLGYEKAAEETLLHEMVHVDVYPFDGHGEKFQNDMLRLAKAGAFRDLW